MAETTAISWCDATFNPAIGCTKISKGCDDCYAARSTPARVHGIEWGPGMLRQRTSAANWRLPQRLNKTPFYECLSCRWRGFEKAAKPCCDRPYKHYRCPACDTTESVTLARLRLFCASLADWLDLEWPIQVLVDLLDEIRKTPNLDWLLVTKRIGNWRKRLEEAYRHVRDPLYRPANLDLEFWIKDWLDGTAPHNVWMIITVIDQAEADRDIPKLLQVPAVVRGLSVEPMLGAIDLCEWLGLKNHHTHYSHNQHELDAPGLHWVICGGESGSKARAGHPSWYRSLRDQCAAAGVAFHWKQHGEWVWVRDTSLREDDTKRGIWVRKDGTTHDGTDLSQFSQDGSDALLWWAGKKAAGRLLDGREHNEFPRSTP